MSPIEELKRELPNIEKILGYSFQEKSLIVLSFVHRSFVNENRKIINDHNERLEFLGDAILGCAISDFLYNFLPHETEGKLSTLRSELVDSHSCCEYLKDLDLEKYILLGKGEQITSRGRKNILADIFEAIIAAIYLDGGYQKAKDFILKHFESKFKKRIKAPSRNYKAELQDYFQKTYQTAPIYQTLKETGPQHQKIFHVAVFLNEKEMGIGQGLSKKEAQQLAAKNALNKFEDIS